MATVIGLAEIKKTLDKLPVSVVSANGSPVRRGLLAAGNVLRKEARANIDKIIAEPNKGRSALYESTGLLKRAVALRRDTKAARYAGQKGEFYVLKLRNLRYPNGVNVNLVGGVLEFGRQGKDPIPAYSWLRNVKTKIPQAEAAFLAAAQKHIDAAIAKART